MKSGSARLRDQHQHQRRRLWWRDRATADALLIKLKHVLGLLRDRDVSQQRIQ